MGEDSIDFKSEKNKLIQIWKDFFDQKDMAITHL